MGFLGLLRHVLSLDAIPDYSAVVGEAFEDHITSHNYTGDQIRLESNYSPDTEQERRAVYEAERPFVKAFEYADHPGYAVVTVSAESVKMSVCSGVGRQAWTTLNLSRLVFA